MTFVPTISLALLGTLSQSAGAPVSVTAVDAVFQEWNSDDGPGCALGVIRDGRFRLEKGYGMANLEHGVPITTKTVFRIGSVSKQFAAFAMLLAARDGGVDLDAGIRAYLPELPRVMEAVTLRHLIHHTSGIRDYLSLMSLAGRREEDWYTEEEVMQLLTRQENLNFPPGTEYLYSNSGYFLLSQIIRRVTGRTLEEYSQELMFEPLGMSNTHFHDDFRRIVPDRAMGYRPRRGGGFEIDMTTLNMVGDGGVFTSVQDLLAWDRNFETGEVGGPALKRERTTPGRLRNGVTQDYAFGLRVSTYRGLDVVQHGGAFVGYRAAMIRFPEKRFSVYALCNSASATPSRYVREVAELFLANEFPDPPTEQEPIYETEERRDLSAYSGLFWNDTTGSFVEIVLDDSGLLWQEEERRLIPRPGDVLLVDDPVSTTRLAFDDELRDSFVLSSSGQRDFEYRRVRTTPLGLAERVDYLGEYLCRELDATYRVELNTDDELVLRTSIETYRLRDAFSDTFRSDSGTVAFERDENGRVAAFELSWFRARNFRFERQ